jgi:hypothetical protein
MLRKVNSARASLEKLTTAQARKWFSASAIPKASPDNPLSRSFIDEILNLVLQTHKRLEILHETNTRPLATGTPGDDWALGFIWGMGVAWHEMTDDPVAVSGRFTKFLEATCPEIETDRRATIDWDARVKTARERFRMDQAREHWLRPGDDITTTG